MHEDDSNSGFEMISSQPDQILYESVPEDKTYRFKLSSHHIKPKKVCYVLKKGLMLPYTTNSGGFAISFSKSLEPTVAGYSGFELGGIWDLVEKEPDNLMVESDAQIEVSTDAEGDLTALLGLVEKAVPESENRIYKYQCPLCSFRDEMAMFVANHVIETHPTWKEEVDLCPSKSTSPSSETVSLQLDSPSSSFQLEDTQESAKSVSSSQFTNQDWLENLKKSLKSDILSKCSLKVREAIDKNAAIEDIRERREIRNTIINSVVDRFICIFGGVSRPKVCDVREVVTQMQFMYPAMFKEEGVGTGYGFGGNKGINGLANQILDRIRSRDLAATKKAASKIVDNDGVGTPKRVKRKLIFGVDNEAWYVAKESEVKQSKAALAIQHVNDEPSFEDREKVYEENRREMQVEFRKSRKPIPQVCRGFWEDYRHLQTQFQYLTKTSGLLSQVEMNFKKQMDHLEVYLRYCCKTVEFAKFMDDLDLRCQAEFNGSILYKYVQILRYAGDHFDKSGAALVRVEEDGPPSTDSPHILAICRDTSWMFELWVDKTKVLVNLSITQAIASFLHMAFVFDLHYPKECQTLADIWQRKFAKYGDHSGTRTHSRKEAAKTKIDKYLVTLGNIMTD